MIDNKPQNERKVQKMNVFLNTNCFTLCTDEVEGDETKVSITYKDLAKDVYTGARILIDDGLIELEVISIKSGRIVCKNLSR